MLSRKKRVAFGEPKTHSEHWIYSSRFVVLLGFSVAASVDAVWRVDHNRPRLPYRESVSSMTPRHLSSLGSRMNHDDVMVRQCRSRLARIAAGVLRLGLCRLSGHFRGAANARVSRTESVVDRIAADRAVAGRAIGGGVGGAKSPFFQNFWKV